MPVARLGRLDIHYQEAGEGDPVVLVNGTGESGQTWVGQSVVLAERYRCVMLDNRDVGRSSYLPGPYAPADMAEDLAGLMEWLDLGPSHLIGYSLGGAIVQELALVRPELVRSMVLLSSWAASDGWFRAQMRAWQGICRHYSDGRGRWRDERQFLVELFPWLFSARTYETPGAIEGLLAFAMAEEPTQRPDGFLRQCEADVAHDAAARLPALEVPALVVVGEQDICTPPRYSHELCSLIPGSQLALIHDAAHGALWERPDAVNAAIVRFLASV